MNNCIGIMGKVFGHKYETELVYGRPGFSTYKVTCKRKECKYSRGLTKVNMHMEFPKETKEASDE